MIQLGFVELLVIFGALVLAGLIVSAAMFALIRGLTLKGQVTFNFDGLRERRLRLKYIEEEEQ